MYLVNKEKLDAFCTKMRIYNLDARSVYSGPKEAAVQLGISMEMVHQLASRADALYRINGNYFVHVGKVKDYIQHFQVKVFVAMMYCQNEQLDLLLNLMKCRRQSRMQRNGLENCGS